MRRGGTTAAVFLMAAALTACGSTVSGTSTPGEIDVRTLNVGKYATVPYHAHNDEIVPMFHVKRDIAAMRLADHVATAYDIDPRLKTGYWPYAITTGVLPEALGRRADLEPIAVRHKLAYGLETNGSDKSFSLSVGTDDWATKSAADETIVVSMVMQFPDADRAKLAAKEFYDADFAASPDNQPVTLSKYTGAHSYWRPGSPFLRTMLAHGSFVVAFLVSTPTANLDPLQALAEKSYETQLPMLDRFRPIPLIDVFQLRWDPDNLVSRTLADDDLTPRPSYSNRLVTAGRQGMLHFAKNREAAKAALAALNSDAFGMNEENLVARTPDAATARKIVADLTVPYEKVRVAAAPANVPNAACAETKNPRFKNSHFTCVVAYHEYVGIVSSAKIDDVHQRAAAQYALLANS
ncbi:hypothetical protein [Nocardia sp. XZ_19_385]|uniref:DUF7373 family lipoprotein n=1 Tax=Nocardia sp. XZ_19_385 TaxID=2769488 RepID=UPI00188FDC5D|nr:hypothetical protein [Nocardia sp. XZ_19_385]